MGMAADKRTDQQVMAGYLSAATRRAEAAEQKLVALQAENEQLREALAFTDRIGIRDGPRGPELMMHLADRDEAAEQALVTLQAEKERLVLNLIDDRARIAAAEREAATLREELEKETERKIAAFRAEWAAQAEAATLRERVAEALEAAEDLSHDLSHYPNPKVEPLVKAELVVDILAGNDSRVERARAAAGEGDD